MNFIEIQKIARSLYYPAFLLEDIISRRIRRKIHAWLMIFTILLFFASVVTYLVHTIPGLSYFSGLFVFSFEGGVYGFFTLFLLVHTISFLLEALYYSYLHTKPDKNIVYIDFDLGYIIHTIKVGDLSIGFFSTDIGQLILFRAGVSGGDWQRFVQTKKVETSSTYEIKDNYIDLSSFVGSLITHDASLSEFFFTYGIQKKELVHIAEWVSEAREAEKNREYWWSRDSLNRIPGIGQEWSYGRAYSLERYSRSLPSTSLSYEVHSSYGAHELKELETVLSRRQGGNVLLVGNDTASTLQIVSRLNGLIHQDSVLVELKNKDVIVFDHDAFIAAHGEKIQFEKEFTLLLREAMRAGNIILVIENIASFFTSVAGIGSDVASLLEPYLSSSSLKIIALSDTERFHAHIEKNVTLMQSFETILVKDVDETNTIRVLENELIPFESRGFFFTYLAVVALAESAERYFPEGVMPDKAIDLLLEIVPKLESQGKVLVEKKDVIELVEAKTGIPIGEVKNEEKDKLLNLEEILHKRIVGQNEAVKAIASAVRRARSGINSPNRPLGSFLFLGPTGVGKTETTKAVAEVFFGADAQVMRLDMSEYSSFDAPSKLIGSFGGKQDGVLSSMLREHQYGVLLLDEFEKTTQEVMNLFLQILDEGFFSDMSGKKVMARNLIIIATSNAGSDLIWEAVKSGNDLAQSKDMIVDAIVKQGIFKPELLNRFDGVIVFHPLTDTDLRTIAGLMLQKLHERLAERGIKLVINDDLVNFVVQHGTDPKFGARPMNRAIQEKVEQVIAEKIIRGDVKVGESIILSHDDFV